MSHRIEFLIALATNYWRCGAPVRGTIGWRIAGPWTIKVLSYDEGLPVSPKDWAIKALRFAKMHYSRDLHVGDPLSGLIEGDRPRYVVVRLFGFTVSELIEIRNAVKGGRR